jgi:hypothetical protein
LVEEARAAVCLSVHYQCLRKGVALMELNKIFVEVRH